MIEIKFEVNQHVWNFLNSKGEPSMVAKKIVESAWEMDGINESVSSDDMEKFTKGLEKRILDLEKHMRR